MKNPGRTLLWDSSFRTSFMSLRAKREEMCLFEPYTVEKEYHCRFSYVDLTKEYEKMVEDPRIEKKKCLRRMLEEEISKLQQESGYPYIVNIDTVNASNPIKGKIVMVTFVQRFCRCRSRPSSTTSRNTSNLDVISAATLGQRILQIY